MTDESLITIQSDEKNPPIVGIRLIVGYLGLFMMMSGLIVLTPLVTLIYYYDCFYAWWYYLVPAFCSFAIGLPLYLLIRKKNVGRLQTTEAMFLTIAIWIIAILINAIPLFIWGRVGGYNFQEGLSDLTDSSFLNKVDLNKSITVFSKTYYYVKGGSENTFYYFTQAVFESASGFGSVGLTLLPTTTIRNKTLNYNFQLFSYNVSSMSEFLPGTEIFQFHRALLSLIGGVGLVLILTSALSDKSSFQIYLLEGHSDKLLPNLAKSARSMFLIYMVFVGFGTVAYCICGVTFFDALCYSMAAVSTGGFATHASSISFFEIALGKGRATAIEIITMILMFLGAVSFLIHHFLVNRKFKKAFLHYENFCFFFLTIIFVPFIITGLLTPGYNSNSYSGFDGVRHGFFEYFSFITTTGFSSISSYNQGSVAPLAYISFVILPFLGGMGGSTAGGIKQYRISDIFISVKESLLKKIRKQEVVHTDFVYKYGEKVPITTSSMRESLNYAVLYITFVLIFSCIPVIFGYSFSDSLFEVSSAFAGLGETSGLSLLASNAHQWGILWSLIISMLLGRLEIVIVLVVFVKGFQDLKVKRHRVREN